MKFLYYSVEDFAADDCFIQWVNDPSPEIDFFWKAFMAKFPEKVSILEHAREIVKGISKDSNEISDEAIAELRINISNAIRDKNGSFDDLPIEKRRNFSALLKFAAIFIGIIIIAGIILNSVLTSDTNTKISLEQRTNPIGQRSSLILPDGSKVWLNAGSKLNYFSNLNDRKIREIFLEGEAYFEVAKNKKKPFIVHANELAIKVLGTSFNVKSFPEDKTVETTLLEGAVSINEMTDNVLLKPNQQAIFSKKEKNIKLYEVDASIASSWKDGRLIIQDERFEEVIPKLERWYGVDLEIKEGKNCRINFKIGKESLKEVLDNINIVSELSYKRVGNKIVIDIKGCN